MPGHIYAQSDKIQEAISAFSAAAANEQKWIASDSLYPTGHYGHNVHFLIHALNLGGRYDDSMKWVQDLFTYKDNPRERSGNNQRTVWRQGYFGLIKIVVRFEKWNEILDGKTIPVYDKPEQNAWRHWAMGLAYSATGQRGQGQGDARRHAQGSRRGDVGEGADRHRRAGARGDDRGARRRPDQGLRAVPQGRATAKRTSSTPSRRRIRGRWSKAGPTWRWRSATTRPPKRHTAKRSSASRAAAAPSSASPRRSTAQGKNAEAQHGARARREGVGERRRQPAADAEAAHQHRGRRPQP